ncbi:hypothetical protein EK599_19575 [Vibrio sp. T187]|uniref:hypothetical protein n=1 Tax=Vibrio TaxID=662 RepID=UPI0010C98DDD|nr:MULTISPECIES: hypothetical protein [Vibrio]MBW3697888.1 hypothetical protein [Vibrio sp. T187]
MDSIYFDNEPNHGINAYFPWGHNFFKTQRDFFQFLEVHYGMVSFQIVEITDDNYQELLVKGVFHAI